VIYSKRERIVDIFNDSAEMDGPFMEQIEELRQVAEEGLHGA
jgi:hypothetical protein